MRKLLLLLLLFIKLSFCFAQVSQFPQVYYNKLGDINLIIHSSPSETSQQIASLDPSSKIGAISLATSTETFGSALWAQVCLPSNNQTLIYGYVIYGRYNARIDQSNNYATVTATTLNVRIGPGTGYPNVQIYGSDATFSSSAIVALTGSTSNGWYQIYLPINYCNQSTGWVLGSYLSLPSSQNYYIAAGDVHNNTNASISGATINFSGLTSTSTTEGFYQYKFSPSWSGDITCSDLDYNTASPSFYAYTANYDYDQFNFILSNTSCNLSAPTNLSTSYVTDQSFDLNWSLVSGATNYTIDVATDNNYTNIVFSNPNLTSSPAPITGLNSNTPYYVRIKATNGAQCSSNYSSTTVQTLSQQTNQPPVASFSSSVHVIYAGQSVQFYDQSTNDPTERIWNFYGGIANDPTSKDPIVTYNVPGTYRVSLHACNSFGCSSPDAMQEGYINVQPTATTQVLPPINYCSANSNQQYSTGEPILTGTGTYRYRHADFDIPFLDMPLTFTRTYNSSNHLQNSIVGYGWSFSYDYYLVNKQDTLWDIHYPDGHTATFVPEYDGNGASFPLYAGTFDTLSKTSNEYTLTANDNNTYLFDSEGKLTQITDRNNNNVTLIYNGELLQKIQTSSGRELDITYNSNNNISSVSTPTGLICYYDYDANGNLILFQDESNNKTLYTYDSSHQLLSLIDPNGDSVLTNTYDSESRIISQTDAYDKTTSIVYDSPSQGDATITYPDTSQEIVHHDSLYRETQITDALGYTKYYGYDSNNNRISIINENNEQETRRYDSKGNLLNQILPGNRSTSYQYNSFNEPIYKQDANGNVTTYDYDNKGNLLTVYYPDNSIRSYNYNSDGTVNTYTDARGNIASYSYNSNEDLVGITKGNTTKSFDYYEDGRLKYQTDENHHTTTFTYEGDGNIIEKKDALDQHEQFVYDSAEHLIAYTDKKGFTTKYNYDKKGRMITKTNALNGIISYAYDDKDNVKSVTDENGNIVSYTYDAKGRKKSKTNALGTTTYDYDGIGNLIKETDANQKSTSYSYANSNKIQSITNAVGGITKFEYDKNNNLISNTDALGNITQYKYDVMNRFSNIIDAANKTTTIIYDENGNRKSITDPNKHTRNYTYDVLDRLTDYLDATNNNIHYDYDNAGNLVKITKPTGIISKVYDAINRVDTVNNSTGDNYIFNYDEDNNIVSMSNNAGMSSFKYDSLSRMIQYNNPFSKQVSFSYDAAGNKTSIVYPGNLQVKYAYDKANNLSSVTDWLSHLFSYNYYPDGRLSSLKYPNNISCTYKYDDAGQLIEKKNTLANGTLLTGSTFTLDAIGNRVSEQRTGPQPSNLLPASFSYSYNDNKLTSDSLTSYTNDYAGNRINQTNTTSVINYDFSVDNLLQSISDGNTTSTFKYDAEGNRISKTTNNTTGRFVLDLSTSLSKFLQVTDGSGNTNMNYVYGAGLLESIDANNNPLYYQFDAQHNTTVITDQNDSIKATYSYDPFGVLLNKTGNINQPFTFLGEYSVEQEDSSLYYVRARYYDAMNGRFLSKDAFPFDLNNPQTLNEYVYALNNPLIRFDKSGFYGNYDWQNNNSQYDYFGTFLNSFNDRISNITDNFGFKSLGIFFDGIGMTDFPSLKPIGNGFNFLGNVGTAVGVGNTLYKSINGTISNTQAVNEYFNELYPSVVGKVVGTALGPEVGVVAEVVAEGSVWAGKQISDWFLQTSVGDRFTNFLSKIFYQ